MKNITWLVGVLFVISLACKKQDDRVLLDATFFELDNCFSTNSLAEQEIIITNLSSYKSFEDDIRRHFFASCDTVFLPAIDFENYFFTGKYTCATACQVNYSRQIYFNISQNKYDYQISLIPDGNCEMMLSSFNCAIVPIKSDSVKVNFIVSNN